MHAVTGIDFSCKLTAPLSNSKSDQLPALLTTILHPRSAPPPPPPQIRQKKTINKQTKTTKKQSKNKNTTKTTITKKNKQTNKNEKKNQQTNKNKKNPNKNINTYTHPKQVYLISLEYTSQNLLLNLILTEAPCNVEHFLLYIPVPTTDTSINKYLHYLLYNNQKQNEQRRHGSPFPTTILQRVQYKNTCTNYQCTNIFDKLLWRFL